MRTPEFLRSLIEWAAKRSDLYQKCEAARKHEYAMNAEYNVDLNRLLDRIKGDHASLKKTYATTLRKRNAETERAEAVTALWNAAEKALVRSKAQCQTAEEKIKSLNARIEELQTRGGPVERELTKRIAQIVYSYNALYADTCGGIRPPISKKVYPAIGTPPAPLWKLTVGGWSGNVQ